MISVAKIPPMIQAENMSKSLWGFDILALLMFSEILGLGNYFTRFHTRLSHFQHPAQYLGDEVAGMGLNTGGLAFARTGYVEDERHGMLGGKELSKPLAYLADGIRLAE